jgi:hypothetical protein
VMLIAWRDRMGMPSRSTIVKATEQSIGSRVYGPKTHKTYERSRNKWASPIKTVEYFVIIRICKESSYRSL